jgi:hypothetical protein
MGYTPSADESRGRGKVSSYRKGGAAARSRLILRAGVLAASVLLFQGCGSGTKAPAVPPHDARASVCKVDQTREFYCDDLLPLAAALPAPAPYETCPSSIESAVGQYDPPPAVALFDSSYTQYTRKKTPPGSACCYSWCSSFKIGDARVASSQAACATAAAFREEYCMSEPEQGTSSSAGSPFDRCASAIVPPARAVFSVPQTALFDANATATHRSEKKEGESAALSNPCCYAWCSQAPPGSGLQKKR